jgi:hypothetical protein
MRSREGERGREEEERKGGRGRCAQSITSQTTIKKKKRTKRKIKNYSVLSLPYTIIVYSVTLRILH